MIQERLHAELDPEFVGKNLNLGENLCLGQLLLFSSPCGC